MLDIVKEKHQSGCSGEVGTLQGTFLHTLSFVCVSVLKDTRGRRESVVMVLRACEGVRLALSKWPGE